MQHPLTFELATTDKLTGLLSTAYFRHLLREELLPQAQERSDPLSIALVDIDQFSALNKDYGRRAGDAALVQVANTLKEALPENAIISRYSGDEFCAALPDARLDDTFSLAEEFRRRVTDLRWEEWPELRVVCSIGLAAFPTNGEWDVELMRQADGALYTAKITGRNKVALPLTDSRMVTKTSHYSDPQLRRLSHLAKTVKRNEAGLLREALDDLLKKYNDRLGGPSEE